jgi:hypothetical protein
VNRPLRGLLVAAALLFASPALAQDPPQVWVIRDAAETISFFGGKKAGPAPLQGDSVWFGWTWSAPATASLRIPDTTGVTLVNYLGERQGETGSWSRAADSAGFPPVAVGPGGELVVVDSDLGDGQGAERWINFLDQVEAAFRQGRSKADHLGIREIGSLGACKVRSAPLPDGEAGREPLLLPLLAWQQRGEGEHVEIQARAGRFVRWIEPACRPDTTSTLRLFTPGKGIYAIDLRDVQIGAAPLAAIGPPLSSYSPSLRLPLRTDSLPSGISLRRSDITRNLCELEGFEALCAHDRAYRLRLYTALSSHPSTSIQSTLRQACIAELKRAPQGQQHCMTGVEWDSIYPGLYRFAYPGPIILANGVVSEVGDDGKLRWTVAPQVAQNTDTLRIIAPGTTSAVALALVKGGGLEWLLWVVGALVLAALFWWLFWGRKRAAIQAELAGAPGVRALEPGMQRDTAGRRMRVPAALSTAIQEGQRKWASLRKQAPPQAAEQETVEPVATQTGKAGTKKTEESSAKRTAKPGGKDTVGEPPPPPPAPRQPAVVRPRSARIRYVGDSRIVRAARQRAEAVASKALEAEHGVWMRKAREELEKLKEDAKKDLDELSTNVQGTLLKKEEEHKQALDRRGAELHQALAKQLEPRADKAVRDAAAGVRAELKADARDILDKRADAHIQRLWTPFEEQRTALQHLLSEPETLAGVEWLYTSVRSERDVLERVMALLNRLPERETQLGAMERLLEDPDALARVEKLYGRLRNEPGLLRDTLLLLDRLPDEDVLMLLDPEYRRESAGAAEEADALDRYRQLVDEMADPENASLFRLFGAGNLLGHWIERHLRVLRDVAGGPESRFREIRSRLPPPAAKEFASSRITLERFAHDEANVFRRILDVTSQKYRYILGPVKRGEGALLERWGLLARDRPLHDRVRQYLEPPERPGRLSEVAQALQYLFEALPVEHLSQEERSRLHEHLQPGADASDGAYEFHALLQEMALGVGLRYHPLPYYRSTANQNLAVREEVTAISLTEIIGRAATTKPLTIVRTARPFFFDAQTGIYYAGHAYVAQ